MAKPTKGQRSAEQKQKDHHSEQMNQNIGTDGTNSTNSTNSKVHGDRGAQLNPNRKR